MVSALHSVINTSARVFVVYELRALVIASVGHSALRTSARKEITSTRILFGLWAYFGT
jgi:hypothetical protein